MKPILVVAGRTFGRLIGQSTTVVAGLTFLAATGAFFTRALLAAEGQSVSVQSLWAVAAVRALPILASLLTMRLWDSDGGADGTELDLVAPVPERAFAFGRLLGAYAVAVIAVSVSLIPPLFLLPRCVPSLSAELTLFGFAPALLSLFTAALPMVAIGSLAGAVFRRAAPAAVASFAVTCALPYAAYRAAIEWCPAARMGFAEPPLEAIVADASDGCLSLCAMSIAVALTFLAAFVTSKAFAMRRLVGDGNVALKTSSMLSMASAALAVALFSVLVCRIDLKVGTPSTLRTSAFSARTREILSDVAREVRMTAFIRRSSPEFLPVARLMRAIAAESRTVAGAGVSCEFVDPRWDPIAAGNAVKAGLSEGSVVFSSGRRRITVPAKEFDEGACASAIQRLAMPAQSERIAFTAGHGETSIEDFSPNGASTAARALRQEGYRVETLFFATSSIPADCSALVISDARTPLSAAERSRIEMFIAQGGHLFATVSPDGDVGINGLAEAYGIAPRRHGDGTLTTDGSNVVISEFGDHTVSRPLHGAAVILAPGSASLSVAPTAAAKGSGFSFTPLCLSNGRTFAMAAEKGASLKSDLAIRPARIVAVGDTSFLRNGSLAVRANANRDLFLNSIAWLAGRDVSGSAGAAGNVISVGVDRGRRILFALSASCGIPIGAAIIGLLIMFWKRGHS